VNRREAIAALSQARMAHLATVTPEGHPHIVPVTFAFVGNRVVTMVDHKPKTTTRLQRLANVQHHPRASLLTDHYEEDWEHLWWVRVDGQAELHEDDEIWNKSRQELAAKYDQYRERPPEGAAIAITMDRVTWWESTP
jgi:PPOX class probable F420-dependent enzyme